MAKTITELGPTGKLVTHRVSRTQQRGLHAPLIPFTRGPQNWLQRGIRNLVG
jgi:hypothetical protein